jgi:hypothetical protein
MSQIAKNELKHLLNPDTGEWIAEYDPVLAAGDAVATAYGQTTKILHTVDSAKKCFIYGLLVTNNGDSDATYALLCGTAEGGTADYKTPPIYIGVHDVHDISRDPRAPILTFGTASVIGFRTGGGTIHCVMSFWEAEIE